MRYLNELRKLNLPKNAFAVFGGGPMSIRDIRQNKDIDIIVKKNLWDKLVKIYSISTSRNSIKIGHIEIFKDWKPWFKSVNPLIDEADIINDLRFVKLYQVVKWKKMMGRKKDIRDIKLIKKYLAKAVFCRL